MVSGWGPSWYSSPSVLGHTMVTCHISLSTYLLAVWYSIQWSEMCVPETWRSKQQLSELALRWENQSVGQRHAGSHAVHMFSVLTEDTEVGGHSAGMWLVPMFTTKNITLQGINHRVSLAPTTVTQTNHNPADLLLLDIGVSVYIIFKQTSHSQCVWTLQKCIIYLS